MSAVVTIVAQDVDVRSRLAALIPEDRYRVMTSAPAEISPSSALFVVGLPGLATPEAELIEQLRANEETATVPIIIASELPMEQLQSVDYIASDWTIALVTEPVEPQVLVDTINFLLADKA